MSKIVIFIAIVALACVNAQLNPWNNPLWAGNGLSRIFPQNFVKLTPEDIKKMTPVNGGDVQGAFMSQSSSPDGTVTRIVKNDNGQVKDYTFKN